MIVHEWNDSDIIHLRWDASANDLNFTNISRLYQSFFFFQLGVGFANFVLKNCIWNVHLCVGVHHNCNEPQSQGNLVRYNPCFEDITNCWSLYSDKINTIILIIRHHILLELIGNNNDINSLLTSLFARVNLIKWLSYEFLNSYLSTPIE